MSPIRVVLVDDHPVVLGGLRALLESLPDFEVVGTATDGEAGVREVVLTRPDVVLMDIRMPGIDGLEATRRIRESASGVAVLVLTMFDDDDTVFGAMRAGAQGYLLKGADQVEIDRAIRAVVAGEAIFSPGVAQRVLGYFTAPPPVADPFPDLTAREREVLDLMAAGERNQIDRRPALPLAEDRRQPHLLDLREARRRRPVRRHRARAAGRAGRIMTAVLAAAAVLGLVATASGWFIRQSGRSRLSAACLVLGGVALLVGCAAASARPRRRGLPGLPARRPACCCPSPCWRTPVSPGASRSPSCCWWSWSARVSSPSRGTGRWSRWGTSWWSRCCSTPGGPSSRATPTTGGRWRGARWPGSSAGLAAAAVGFVSESANAGGFPDLAAAFIACLVVGPVAMVVGVVRPDVVDVRGLVTRAVVAGTVLVTYVSVAIGLTSTIEAVRGRPLEVTPTIVLCAVLAFGVRPLQVMLRGVVDQLLFGDRPDALAAATSLADRIGDDPALALDAVREALVLPYASIRAGGEELASSGTEVTHTRVLPLRLGEDEVGEVVVGLRAGDFGLSAADEDVLRIVAPLLAQTLRARQMSRDLQKSREAVVAAVEEERRRLRRDLHDGLGPTLSGVAFATDAARNQVRSNPDRADELLVQLRADTASAITEIRRLVEGLRPPALDELGLEGAIRQHASALHSSAGLPLPVSVSVPSALPPLSAATEVAAYRIVVEALTNVVRHSAASRADVSLVRRGRGARAGGARRRRDRW